jgi:adenosylmethionine---8-amino-7-oxononanoate aminotransferase
MTARSERTRELEAADKRHLWHPFTQATEWEEEPILVIDRAEGCWLEDTDGNRYLDGVSSLWVNVHGHRRQEIDDAIRAQLDRIAHTTLLGLACTPSVQLAERLAALAPGSLSRVFFSDDGSTSVEVALKMAYQHFKQRGRAGDSDRTKFIAFTDAYHGDTVGSVSLGGIDVFHGMYRPLLFDALRVPYPHCYRCPMGVSPESCERECERALEDVLSEHGSEACALIIEPLVQGAAGIITAPEGYLARTEALCRKHGVLLICDEVATGFGRTGRMFACEHEGVEPDFLCLAKGITGGYLPLAATLTTDAVYDAFRGPYAQHRTFYHGHSYTGNPLASAAALANLDLFESERVIEVLQDKVARLREALERKVAPLPHVGEVRQRGMMVGIELVADRATKAPFPTHERRGRQVILEARKHGVMIRPLGDVVVLMPPLAISNEELELLVNVTAKAIEKVTAA